MRTVRIYPHQVGLVRKKGTFRRALSEGLHLVGLLERVAIYDQTKPFQSPFHLEILLQDPILKESLLVVDVKDNEIALQYEFGKFKDVLPTGRHAFWKSVIDYDFTFVDLSTYEITEDISESALQSVELTPYVLTSVVESYEKGILYVNGKSVRVLDPGLYHFWKNSEVVNIVKADLRKQQMEILGQEILTKDKAALRSNFNVQYQIVDVEKAVVENKDALKQLYVTVQMAFREFISNVTLDELLGQKDSISQHVLAVLEGKAEPLGIQILNAGIKDIILPGDIKEIMNQVLIAQKQAQANTITRREETASTRSLLNTAKLMEENEMLFRLKEMEYIEKIAQTISDVSVTGGAQVVDQLKQMFVPEKSA